MGGGRRRRQWGRRDGVGGNRCGHDPLHFVRPAAKRRIPPILTNTRAAARGRQLPPLNGYVSRRSELAESFYAFVDVAVPRTDVRSWRIGRPSRKRPGRFDGLSVDHDLARLMGISESRVERMLVAAEDWGFLRWHAVPKGRRKAKRGFLRCASQPIDRKGRRRRGLAAIRQWTEAFWEWAGVATAMHEAQQKATAAAKRAADVVGIPAAHAAQLAHDLADLLGLTNPARPRPPP
jgi:hypothetical protein